MYFAGVVNRAPARGIEEWLPTSWGSFTGQTFMISLAVTVCWLARNTRRLTIRETLLLGAFCILAAHSIRMVVWWGIVLAVVASRDIGSAARPLVRSRAARSFVGKHAGGCGLADIGCVLDAMDALLQRVAADSEKKCHGASWTDPCGHGYES